MQGIICEVQYRNELPKHTFIKLILNVFFFLTIYDNVWDLRLKSLRAPARIPSSASIYLHHHYCWPLSPQTVSPSLLMRLFPIQTRTSRQESSFVSSVVRLLKSLWLCVSLTDDQYIYAVLFEPFTHQLNCLVSHISYLPPP